MLSLIYVSLESGKPGKPGNGKALESPGKPGKPWKARKALESLESPGSPGSGLAGPLGAKCLCDARTRVKKHLHLSRGNIFVSLKNFSFANPAVVLLHALGFEATGKRKVPI